MAKGKVRFFADRCKACGLCIEFCPKDVLGFDEQTINVLGYHPIKDLKPELCTGCAICGIVCPDLVIEVERE